ncbi:queuosine precursor transporter [Candidatus Parcubacteria bacterium]|nr:queuosine precursor transporter [Candidatus Parcubacteria bacterium]
MFSPWQYYTAYFSAILLVMDEMLLLGLSLVFFLATAWSARFGKAWLYAVVVINLLFVSLFGAKLISVFDQTTNAGNIFYAVVFFATYLLIENYSTQTARHSIYIGLFGVALFLIASRVIVTLTTLPESALADQAIASLVILTPNIAFASVVAFFIASHANILIYDHFRTLQYPLVVGLLIALSAAQCIDSLIFFSLAFSDKLASGVLFETMWVGFTLKVVLGIISIPFIYLNVWLKEKQKTLLLE